MNWVAAPSSVGLELSTRVEFLDSWPTSVPLPAESIVSLVRIYSAISTGPGLLATFFSSDNPTNKYGEALRAQVEERLAFYEVS